MKYFTPEWWDSGCEGADDVWERYGRYIESVRDRLPAQAIQFDANHTLHDSEVKVIACNFEQGEAQLTFIGWDTKFEQKTSYRLTFGGVTQFEQTFPQQDRVESELGDLGYWEWEAVAEGTELRMLFVSSAMFRLRFREFAFTNKPVKP